MASCFGQHEQTSCEAEYGKAFSVNGGGGFLSVDLLAVFLAMPQTQFGLRMDFPQWFHRRASIRFGEQKVVCKPKLVKRMAVYHERAWFYRLLLGVRSPFVAEIRIDNRPQGKFAIPS